MNLKEKIKNLPSSPGVYLYKDSQENIIYVGKAINLKRRVASYFQNSKAHSPKVEKLIKHVNDFEYLLTDTEFEALLLECKLIKEYKPIYNKKMKSTQSYTYIVIQKAKRIPRIINTRNPIYNETNQVFGPYASMNTVEKALQGLKEYYQIMCGYIPNKSSLCLNHSLGLCFGMCSGGLALEKYTGIINKVIALLNGYDTSIIEELEQKMEIESKKSNFEAAAKYRDYLSTVKYLINKEKVIGFAEKNKNIAVVEYLSNCVFKIFFIRGNTILFSEVYHFSYINHKEMCENIKSRMIEHFNMKESNSHFRMGKDELDETQIIYNYINNSNCRHLYISENWLTTKENSKLDDAIYNLVETKNYTNTSYIR